MRIKFMTFVVLTILLAACGSFTPPGADMAGGGTEDANYTYLRWPNGARLLFWYGETVDGGCDGSGSTTDPVYTVACRAELTNGRLLTWEVRTEDGQAIDLLIDGVPYDLAAGNLFLLDAAEAGTAVTQLSRDLSTLPMQHDEIIAFSQRDEAIAAFLAGE